MVIEENGLPFGLLVIQPNTQNADMQQMEKLEIIGQMSAGIAHDFNNVLAGIIGFAELAQRQSEPGHPVQKHLNAIIKKADGAANLVRRLMSFSRNQTPAFFPMNLNGIIIEMQKFLQRFLGEHIELQLSLEEELPPVMADQTMIEQILTNLCVNARDAMPDGGQLIVATRTVTESDSSWNLPASRCIELVISDSGIGMDNETLQHIFETFFTTKEMGRGTGLGLAIVDNLVKQHNGIIRCESRIGEGTVFRILFPVTENTTAKKEKVFDPVEFRGGTETILLVEDDADLRKNLRKELTALGYAVLTAKNGTEALKVYEENKDILKLVISDIIMPEMGGIELKLFLSKENPVLKFLFISGTNEIIEEDTPCLMKPFHSIQLATEIRRTLDYSE